MPTTTTPKITFVDTPEAIADALAALEGAIVGVDVERADAHRYYRRAALVQVGLDDACVLLDGVTLDTMGPLDTLLSAPRTAVLHAADNDLIPLERKGVQPELLADTALAATLLGLPRGLDRLLDEVLGITVDGDKQKFQRADWEQRPLPTELRDYAAGDVVHLPALWTRLAEQLADAGRMSWYGQELAALRAQPADDRDWRRVKGIGRLSPDERATLRALWHAREDIAREFDLAPNHLLHDDMLVDFARDKPRTAAQLVRRSQRHRRVVAPHADRLLEALADPEPLDTAGQSPDRRGHVDRDVVSALRRARAEIAERLGIEAGVLCPARPLNAAVAAEPADADELVELAGLRPWQRDLLADVLWEAYTAARAAADD
ncbi:MAG: HRDC domain-containing protein [Nitriliruptoraceae bacterium]